MTEIKLATLILISLFLTGCVYQTTPSTEKPTNTATTTAKQEYILAQEKFSLTFPAHFTIINHYNLLTIECLSVFPGAITIDDAGGNYTIEGEKDWVKQYGGKIISSSNINIAGNGGYKFTVQYDSSNKPITSEAVIKTLPGYAKTYVYVIKKGEVTLRIYTTADNFDNPDQVEKEFEKLVNTIVFK